MEWTNILLIILTLLFTLCSVTGIRISKIKEMRTVPQKISALKPGSVKGTLGTVGMLVLNIGLAVALTMLFEENTMLFNLKRIALVCVLWVAAYYDYKSFRIPNKLIITGLIYRALILIAELIWERDALLTTVVSELIAALAMLVISVLCVLILKNSLGMGDIKLFIVMGVLQGVVGITSSVIASLLVSFVVSVFLLVTKKKTRKDAIPFAPCILIGTYISIFLTGA